MPGLNAFGPLLTVLIFGLELCIDGVHSFFFQNFSTRKTQERAPDLIYCAFIDLFHFINCKFGAMEIYGLKILAIFFSNA